MDIKNFFNQKSDYVKVENDNRFYYMLQQMQFNRWKITAIVLGLFFFIILGINAGVFIGVEIHDDWKEMLLNGWDEVSRTLALEDKIKLYEEKQLVGE